MIKQPQIIIEHKFTDNHGDLEKAADALILIYRALGILPSNPDSQRLEAAIEHKKPGVIRRVKN